MITRAASPARDNRLHLTCERHTARIAGAVLAVTFAISPAQAADMPTPTKAPAPPSYQWTGCYVGLNAGGGTSGTNFGSTVDPGTYLLVANGDPAAVGGSGGGGANADGFIGGGQAGCNWQSGTFLVGLEGDYDYFRSKPNFANNTNTLAAGTPFTLSQSVTTDFLATARPRIGIAADRNLGYITGGAAFTRADYTETYTDAAGGTGAAATAKSLVGWTAGAGWEYALAEHWTFKLEYLYASFQSINALGVISGPGGSNTLHGSTNLVIQVARLGANFKF
jgi:outer membrane immunogenic protein